MEKELDPRLIDKRLKMLKIKKMRDFGYSFAAGMAILFAISIWKNFPLPFKVGIGILCFYHLVLAMIFYPALKPTYWLITNIAKVLGNILSTIIFGVFYYILFTPIALLLRLSGKDVI